MTMLKHERDALLRLTREQEKLAKSAIVAREAELKADFEEKLAAKYHWASNPVWKAAYTKMAEVHSQQQIVIAAECARMGIPEEFQPQANLSWSDRGENAVKIRQDELRKVAYSRIAAEGRGMDVKNGVVFTEARVKILSDSLETDEAKRFLETIPTAQQLMRPLDLDDVEKRLGTEQQRQLKRLREYRGFEIVSDDEVG
jgi:hypothetical protein